jgi:hypothetical protein
MHVVMMVMVVMMCDSAKNRAGKYRHEQRSDEHLLHGPNVA